MPLRKIPLKPLTCRFGDEDSFNYKYVDAMVPRSQRLQTLLKQARRGPIWVNWEGYSSFTKDLRDLVQIGALKLRREHLATRRNMTRLYITDTGLSSIKV